MPLEVFDCGHQARYRVTEVPKAGIAERAYKAAKNISRVTVIQARRFEP